MMNYLIRPSTEEVSMAPGEVDNRAWADPLSAGAHLQVFSGVVCGVLSSLSKTFIAKGMSPDDINSKMKILINEFIQNGDLDTRMKEWLRERDFSNNQWNLMEELDKTQPHEWCAYYDILDEATWGIKDGKWNEDYRKKMNEREKALVDRLYAARKALHEAEREYNDYVHDHAIETMNDVFTKYGELLSKMDKEWYDQTESRIKQEMIRVAKRRKAKLAEADVTSERPVVAL